MNTPIERLETAKLVHFEIIGDPVDDVDMGMSPRWVGIARKTETKLAGYMQNIKQKVNVYIFPGIRLPYRLEKDLSWSEFGKTDLEFRELLMDIDFPNDDSAVNVLMFGLGRKVESRRNIIGPTPWMILHRISHYEYIANNLEMAWLDLMETAYPGSNYYHEGEAFGMKELLTFRSARNFNMDSAYEGIVDFAAHIMKTGKVVLNPFPESIGKLQINPDAKIVSKAREDFVKKGKKIIDDGLESLKGRYLFV